MESSATKANEVFNSTGATTLELNLAALEADEAEPKCENGVCMVTWKPRRPQAA